MNLIEKKYRDTAVNSKKYLKRLSDYICALIAKGRIIEARYYFSKLYEHRPDHNRARIIGYELAIKTFDNKSVLLFDKALVDDKYEEQKLLSLRLKYYYSVNNTLLFSELIKYLLTLKNLKSETLETVVHLALSQEAYEPVALVLNYLKSENKVLHKMMENKLRPIVFRELMNTIIKVKI